MKSRTLTQAYSWLHTWGGLVFGWVLFPVFLTGTLAVFDKEIDGWMRPELAVHSLDQKTAIHRAIEFLQSTEPQASVWNIGLPNARSPNLTVSSGEQRRGAGTYLDAETGKPQAVRETAGGGFFFRFHFTLNLPRNIGIWVVGLAAMAMLVALLSGIVIHKKFFKEFFTFRPAKGQRSWLDAHNATGVLVLPFHLMITYTGLVIFYLIYMPAAMDALFDGDREAATRAMRGGDAEQHGQQRPQGEAPRGERGREPQRGDNEPARGQRQSVAAAPLTPLQPVLAEAERVMGPLAGLSIQHPGRSDARIEVRPLLGNRIELTKGQSMLFDGVTGAVVRQPNASRPSQLTQKVMAGLHFAQFGGYPMRWLYFLCGLASCAMIATGLLLFTVKRRRRHDNEGIFGAGLYRAAERLNIALIAGLALSCVAMLWANRLLPVELAQRSEWEVRVFFAVWLTSLAHATTRPWLSAWREQLGLAALLCMALPVLDLLGDSRGEYGYLHATAMLLGGLLAWGGWKIGQPAQEKPARTARQVAVEANQ